MKYFTLLLLLILTLLITPPAQAALCRTLDGNQICIRYIKRSAKYHWEYRASVSINGVVTPIEKYNCRDRIKLTKNGTIIPFKANGAGELICSFFS
ncbi:conserved hypothetical protein [Gloeothece citriformis PCC 7424]|uniref:Uncharacterized protein n=1 Tax=Gloeothece citriformis (strain PCC 7424) TaxID=65393 RepID=B7KKL9_GLOC7|nr:hypothetical protein [Gloeothece citriformis]ACK72352.1 conserved hypothetical protein [Gloeothece citriformis PCC 7424]